MKTIIIDGIEYNLTPKVLFKKGDFVVIQETTYQITKVENLNVTLSLNGRECIFDIDVLKNAHLWTIQDAKDGDVLSTPNYIYILNRIDKETETISFYCLIKKSDKHFSFGDYRIHDEIKKSTPATKEQRDTLLKAMTDAGYEWDAEKKELRLLITNGDDFFESENCEQKPAEEYSFNIESELFHQLTKEQQELWKKEIEQAYNAGVEASDEWSEEDETKMRAALAFIKSEFPKEGNEEIMEDTIEWFKSLKQRIGG